MASILLLLLLSAFCSVAAQQSSTNITLGSSLSPGTDSSWLSPSGRFAFGFYQQGNDFSVGIWVTGNPETVVWTANRTNPPVSRNAMLLFTNGRLNLKDTQGQEEFISTATQEASSASMLDSGNFVLYDSNSQIIWQSFDSPTNTLLPGQRLLAGKELFSNVSETDHSLGRFRLIMQLDGWLVLYPTGTPYEAQFAYWQNGTAGVKKDVTLNLDDDGHLYLLNSTGSNILDIIDGFPTDGTILYRLTIDVDGILRLYSKNLDQKSDWEIKWSSSSNKCDPKGLCGINGYCTLIDQQSSCNCLHGFYFIDENQKTLGCEKKFSTETCSNKKKHTNYTMSRLKNIVWDDNPVSNLSVPTKEDCENNCLADCDCEVALFENRECRKKKLPVMYVRENLNDSNMAFVKVGIAVKESKKDILIISVSSVACALVVLAFISVLIYRHRVRAHKNFPKHGNEEFVGEIAPRYGELRK